MLLLADGRLIPLFISALVSQCPYTVQLMRQARFLVARAPIAMASRRLPEKPQSTRPSSREPVVSSGSPITAISPTLPLERLAIAHHSWGGCEGHTIPT